MLMPLTNQPVIKKYFGDDVEDKYFNAKTLNQNGFYIGCHPNMEDENVERIINVLKGI
jgi:dTDP-4-amino-4,6-dideoxygalactose transaminase